MISPHSKNGKCICCGKQRKVFSIDLSLLGKKHKLDRCRKCFGHNAYPDRIIKILLRAKRITRQSVEDILDSAVPVERFADSKYHRVTQTIRRRK